MCCYTGGPYFTGSLRHHCVSTDELSVTGREGGSEGGGGWERDSENEWREREREREKKRGVAACETHSRITA